MNFESPVLKQSLFGDGGDWSYADPESDIVITISRNEVASIRDVQEAVQNFRFAFNATADHLVATKHYEELRKITASERFSKMCEAHSQASKFGKRQGPDLGQAAGLWRGEDTETKRKVLTLYKSTVARAYRLAEQQKSAAEENA